MKRRDLRIGIIGSAKRDIDSYTLESVKKLGRLLARENCEVVTGSAIGAPHESLLEAKKYGTRVIGFSPDFNKEEHEKRYDNAPLSDFDRIFFVRGFTRRSLEMVKYCDAIIVIGGRMGTLSEYTISFEENKVMGVLRNSEGIAEYLYEITKKCDKHRKEPVFFSESVEELFREVIGYLKDWNDIIYDYENASLRTDEELGYKQVLNLVKEKIKGSRVLDYGCGFGKFTKRLMELNPEKVYAVDTSNHAIKTAEKLSKNIVFKNIEGGSLDFIEDGSLDFVFINFVLCCVRDEEDIKKILNEIYEKLKKNGKMIILDPHPDSPGYRYLSGWRERPEKLISGMPLKVKLLGMKNVFYDYWRSIEDYKNFLKEAGFELKKIKEPRVKREFSNCWLDETKQAPTIIFVARK